ncbi:hypothetical protein AB4Y43_01030 [Paraburkholderia sp. BR10872]|uniref:hypothetical protein n=1 Tax=Paraburkholderia sp. BR10872 TaxID=3236989 RepID=UPI0034D16BAC
MTDELIKRLRHYIDSLAPPMAKRYIEEAIRELETQSAMLATLESRVSQQSRVIGEMCERAGERIPNGWRLEPHGVGGCLALINSAGQWRIFGPDLGEDFLLAFMTALAQKEG